MDKQEAAVHSQPVPAYSPGAEEQSVRSAAPAYQYTQSSEQVYPQATNMNMDQSQPQQAEHIYQPQPQQGEQVYQQQAYAPQQQQPAYTSSPQQPQGMNYVQPVPSPQQQVPQQHFVQQPTDGQPQVQYIYVQQPMPAQQPMQTGQANVPLQTIAPQQTGGQGVARGGYQFATPLQSLNLGPAPVDCPVCGQRGLTNTAMVSGDKTTMWALIICFFTCLGCIAYMMDELKDVQHRCSKCGTLLATWHRGGATMVHVHPQ